MTGLESPVAAWTMVDPPRPITRASAEAHNLFARSSKCSPSSSKHRFFGKLGDSYFYTVPYRGLAERLADLGAVDGTCFVNGNHEHFSGLRQWQGVIRSMGWRILENEHLVLSRQGERIVVAGLPDPAGRVQPDLARALGGAPAAPTIRPFHRPSGVEEAEKAGISLQLSGHTHGGQFFPWNLLIHRMWAFPPGLARLGRMWIYTSPGTGVWGPPNRFLVPTELTLLVLRQSNGCP